MGVIVSRVIVPVPHQSAYIIEQFGKYHTTLNSGLNFLIPFVQKVAYKHSLKEQTYMINASNAVTKDNVILTIDGVLYIKIDDPIKCSYGALDPLQYAQIMAQSIMRSELGKLTLDQTFEERDRINQLILQELSEAVENWGMKCLRYEIKDIHLNDEVKSMMVKEAEAEREKRGIVLQSEAQQQFDINLAQGIKRSQILKGQGIASQTLLRATATVQKINFLNQSLDQVGGDLSAQYNIAEAYIEALKQLEGKNILIKGDVHDPKQVIESSLSILQRKQQI